MNLKLLSAIVEAVEGSSDELRERQRIYSAAGIILFGVHLTITFPLEIQPEEPGE